MPFESKFVLTRGWWTESAVVFLRLDKIQVQKIRYHAPLGQQRANLLLALLAPAAELSDPPKELGTGGADFGTPGAGFDSADGQFGNKVQMQFG